MQKESTLHIQFAACYYYIGANSPGKEGPSLPNDAQGRKLGSLSFGAHLVTQYKMSSPMEINKLCEFLDNLGQSWATVSSETDSGGQFVMASSAAIAKEDIPSQSLSLSLILFFFLVLRNKYTSKLLDIFMLLLPVIFILSRIHLRCSYQQKSCSCWCWR